MTTQEVPFRSYLRYFLWLGTFGFGGPIATVGYMQRDLVERRAWLDREEFLNGVALGQTMPGPLAAQVAMWVGYLQRGAFGAAAVMVPFIAPSFIIVLTFAYFYVRYEGISWVQSLFYGIAPAVMAIIVLAAVKLARLTNKKDARLWVISAATMAVTAATGAEIAWMFVAAGFLMLLWDAPPKWLRRGSAPLLLPVALLTRPPRGRGELLPLALFFLKAGAFIFGSGLAIVPFLREGVVGGHHWLNERQFLDAVAMGLITPGPVVITAAFIGFIVASWLGAFVATVAIFVPIYLGVIVPGPWFVKHRAHPQIQAFVRGATAAAAGAIGGATIVLIRKSVIDIPTGIIMFVALVALWKYKVKEPFIVIAAGIAGLLLH